MNFPEIKDLARTLFLEGVRAADPALAVAQALEAKPLLPTTMGRQLVIAFGKAACAMMQEALKHVPDGQEYLALAVTNYENAINIAGCQVHAAGHPLPDQNGIDAGIKVTQLLRSATQDDKVLCLISGGGSALLPTPRTALTLADKIQVNEVLLSGGLDIVQMNAVRQQLSVLKGGGLLDIAHPAWVRSLIISDVVGDDISAIASGPTAPVQPRPEKTIALLKSEKLWEKLPKTAQTLLNTLRDVSERDGDNTIICSNMQSLESIFKAAPEWNPLIITDKLTGDVKDAAQQIVNTARVQGVNQPQLLIWGGETTVTLQGKGKGGRNQELSLHVARCAADLPGDWVFLSAGTDGRDGPTDAAGGIVTPGTIARARSADLNVAAALQENDSYRVLQAAGDLLVTGATGTNVADVQLLFRMP